MRTNLMSVLITVQLLLVVGYVELWAQEQPQQPQPSRFSHKGIKGAIGFGSLENEFEGNFPDGGAGMLSLGYGFDDHFTLWGTLVGAGHPSNARHEKAGFAGLELNLQYRFLPQSPVQPFGKVGVGIYGFEEDGTNTTFAGSGFALGLGADWFFSRHFGIGAELMFKELDYSKMVQRLAGRDVTTDLNPKLDGDATAFMITLTIQ